MSEWFSVPGTNTLVSPGAGQYVFHVAQEHNAKLLESSIPGAIRRPHKDSWLVSAPMHEDTVAILHNMQWPVAGIEPFHFYYTPPKIEGFYDAMPHQRETAAFLASHKRAYCFNTMRTGKTGSLVLAFDYLRRYRGVKGSALIVGTVSTLGGVWERTIRSTLRDQSVVKVYGGSGRDHRASLFFQEADYYVINFDGIKLIQRELEEAVASGKISMVGVDELTHYGNPGSGRWKALNAVINGKKKVEYVYGLTGSPGGNPMAVYGFAKLITPWSLGSVRKTTWQEMCFTRYGNQVWQWREKPEAKQLIQKVLQPQIRFDKKDIMNLPPTVSVFKDAELSPDQARSYRDMLNGMITLTEKGEVITAVNKAALAHKLFQIALGVSIMEGGTDGKELAYFDNAPRLAAIREAVEEAERKVVIFCTYKAAIQRTTTQLRGLGYTVEMVTGDVTGAKRDIIFQNFLHARDPHILVVHPTTTAFGTELASADTLIFDGPPRVGEFIYSQALERLGSMKQKAAQISLVKIAATKEEREAFDDIDNDVKLADSINKLFADLTKRSA